MPFVAPIGQSDFLALRRGGASYVDKTSLVTEVLDSHTQALLFPRPRRFGKTLNLSALRYFLERSDEDRSDLFEGLAVWEWAGARAHFQRYPVVFLSFKDVKHATWEKCLKGLSALIAETFRQHRYLLDEGALDDVEAEAFRTILMRRADDVELMDGLRRLTRHLHAYHGERAVLLVDEYDLPIHAGVTHGYYGDVIVFFRNFLSGGLKDNPHLFKGVLTGILRVARESIFSGLNNLAVHSLLSRRFATTFGFTEAEVEHLARLAGASDRLDEVREWYDGYLFGGEVVYNPWSVLSFLAVPEDGCQPYWASTSSNDLVRDLLLAGGLDGGDLETLLSGGSVEQAIEEHTALRDLDLRPRAVRSLLLFSGYLKAAQLRQDRGTRGLLSIPNQEVRTVYETAFCNWLEAGLHGGRRVRALSNALLAGDTDTFEALLQELLVTSLSYHDTARPAGERVFHSFIVGLLVWLQDEYDVRSNRESGYGRADVLVLPRQAGRPGVALELKSVDTPRGETPEAALESALRQLADRDYAAEVRAAGADPVHEVAAVFDGKRVWAGRRPQLAEASRPA